MLTWIESSGKNEEAAIAAALSQLGLERDDVSVEVLERAKSGFLGIGSAPARVRVSYEAPDDGTVAPAAPQTATKSAAPVEKPAPQAAPKPAAPAAPKANGTVPEADDSAQQGDLTETITAFLTGLMAQMDCVAVPHVRSRKEGGYQVVLEGQGLGALIGHRGETLDAIQQLTNYAINRDRQKRVRIFVDAENYRQKREEALQRLANKVAAKVVKYRRNVTLEPMNAYERHVIHETLQGYPDVVTYSTGTEPHRRTVVAYNTGKHSY